MVKKKTTRQTFGGLSLKYQSGLEKIRKSYLTKEQIEAEKPTLQQAQERLGEKYKKERKELVKKRIEGIGKSAVTLLTSKGKHTILKTPTQKLPSYDAKKIIMKGERQVLVREGRTGFFNRELMEEAKWLS
jgi:hypothetical protein